MKNIELNSMAFPGNYATIILGWQGLPGTNTPAYLAHAYVTKKKCFVNTAPGRIVIKLFKAVIYECPFVLTCLFSVAESL